MADRQAGPVATTRSRGPAGGAPSGSALLHRLQEHAPNSTKFIGFLTLLISGAILLFFTGITVTVTVLALIFLTPLILLSSPIWVPAGTVLLVAGAGFLFVCAAGVATVASASWTYKYVRGRHPPWYDRVDYARSRIADTASHVKDYARDYGGHLQRKVRDAAPGA